MHRCRSQGRRFLRNRTCKFAFYLYKFVLTFADFVDAVFLMVTKHVTSLYADLIVFTIAIDLHSKNSF